MKDILEPLKISEQFELPPHIRPESVRRIKNSRSVTFVVKNGSRITYFARQETIRLVNYL
jgi:hypothetical protein